MLFSKMFDNTIRASLDLDSLSNRELVPIKKISDKLEISFHFLTKIIFVLYNQAELLHIKGDLQ